MMERELPEVLLRPLYVHLGTCLSTYLHNKQANTCNFKHKLIVLQLDFSKQLYFEGTVPCQSQPFYASLDTYIHTKM